MSNPNSLFNSIQLVRPRRSVKDLSYWNLLTTSFGSLTPLTCKPTLPGDKFRANFEVKVQFLPMMAPVMHPMNVSLLNFYCPIRIVWKGAEDFFTDVEHNPRGSGNSSATVQKPIPPYITGKQMHDHPEYFQKGSLGDYLGLRLDNVPNDPDYRVQILRFLCYQMVYKEYFRDQNLEPADTLLDFPTEYDGQVPDEDFAKIFTLRHKCWEKDYFTSALPFAQRGNSVDMPLFGTVVGDDSLNPSTDAPYRDIGFDPVDENGSVFNMSYAQKNPLDASLEQGFDLQLGYEGTTDKRSIKAEKAGSANDPRLAIDNSNALYIKVKQLAERLKVNVEALSLQDFRYFNALQKLRERSAVIGGRYAEWIRGIFGVSISDYRIQRPILLGGGRLPVKVGDVLQSSESSSASPQGTPTGYAANISNVKGFKHSFAEYGYVFTLAWVAPRPAYMQGVDRDFFKLDSYDWFIPQFAHLGEQPIYNAELYGKSADPLGTFGYTPRYAEYSFSNNEIHGDMTDSSMNYWHLARIFKNEPVLNKSFVELNEQKDELSRIFPVIYDEDGKPIDEQRIIIQMYANIRAIRPMPKHPTPML